MIWEIASIEEGERLEDVLLTINYWYDDEGDTRPQRSPDFVEEHLIVGIPQPVRKPKRTRIGQFVALDGSPVMEWMVDDDGELVEIDPESIAEQIQWDDEVSVDALIAAPVADHAAVVAKGRPVGEDRFPAGRRPVHRGSERAAAVATRRRKNLKGRRGVI